MDLISIYLILALATSITALYELYSPVFKELAEIEPDNNMIEYKWLSYFVFFIVNIVLAPIVLLPCLVPSVGESFREGLLKAFKNGE